MSKTDKYSLSDDEKAAIAAQQVEQFKRERYAHELNAVRAETLPAGEEKDQTLAVSRESIAQIEAAIDATLSVVPE